MTFSDFIGPNGHQCFLYISGPKRIVELWDPSGANNPFVIPLLQLMFDSIKNEAIAGYRVVSAASALYGKCPKTGRLLGPQEMEELGFRGSCMTWNIWLMSVRASKGALSPMQLSQILADIQKDHSSLTKFILKFAYFFRDNEQFLDNREEMLKRIHSTNLFLH